MKINNAIMPLVAAVVVTACGGGTSVNDSVTAAADTNTPSSPVTQPATGATLTGRFIDSAVNGLDYSTATQTGETDADGTFNYLAGEDVTFSIGGIVLPAIEGADVITPLSIFGTTNITDVRVMNLASLLQTLDTDGDANNGINISESAEASAAGLSLDFASDTFEDDVVNLIANSGSTSTTLVAGIDALEHLQETLFEEGLEERPAPPPETAEQSQVDPGNPATNALVGRSAEFSNFAHDISGTLTVLDDRTLQVTNFNYDGGGVRVFFYYGTDGNFRDGGPIGPQLNGRRFRNETMTITLPDNLTLDDFNAISVWCIPFFADFGSAQL